jgi:hypothetical protein
MKRLLIALLFLSASNLYATQETDKSLSNTTVITNDNRVIYDEKTKKLIGVKKQTVCKEVKGKKECYDRSVATMIDK